MSVSEQSGDITITNPPSSPIFGKNEGAGISYRKFFD